MRSVRSAAVLGAGTMGAQIAAHLANAGVPALLLDVTAAAAAEGLDRARTLSPDPFFTPETHELIRTGSFDELPRVAGRDLIVEAIVERLDAKQALLERLEPHVTGEAIVSSNTSGIPLASIAAGRSAAFRRRWLGTHFFNPPRYLPLLEIVPTPDTDAALLDRLVRFADVRLGKGVVIAKDTPGFIANRIGTYGVLQILRMLAGGSAGIEEIDAVTGPAIGRPRSATFRTLDMVGLDVLAQVARGLESRLGGDERPAFGVPSVLEALVERGWTGTKAGRGFYTKAENGEILVLDPQTFSYGPLIRPRFASLEAAQGLESTAARLRALFAATDAAGRILRSSLAPMLLYAARVAPEVAHSAADVDRAMRLGFGWELGPFEMLRAIGVEEVLQALTPGEPDAREVLTAALSGSYADQEAPGCGLGLLNAARARGVVRRNAGASLLDIGEGVLCLEFHSKMNAIGGDTIQMLHTSVEQAAAGFAALVIANDAQHFSAGANLMLLLLEAQEGNWDEVDVMVRAFQQATAGLKYADVPVVVCPAGLTLGGACEIALHAAHVQAAGEAYIGLVEAGVGLIPAGGGTKEMLARAMEAMPPGADPVPFVRPVFETIGFARVSTSAADARRLGYLGPGDGITMNRERLIADARALALARAANYVPPTPRTAIPVGGPNLLASLTLGVHLARRAERISDHDALIGRKLAWILAGGNVPAAQTLTEQELLDLEREAFLSLCGEPKTQARIAHTLKTGKPLRN